MCYKLTAAQRAKLAGYLFTLFRNCKTLTHTVTADIHDERILSILAYHDVFIENQYLEHVVGRYSLRTTKQEVLPDALEQFYQNTLNQIRQFYELTTSTKETTTKTIKRRKRKNRKLLP